ncbi:hypothetical protein V6N13_054800 [Hibiscus sabdariffa]|uniref:Uncharacterized protein n=1 Tax=Hibiscus sabdariffa TaxID=183260 RepID=A0ABR2DYC5_9ROSI
MSPQATVDVKIRAAEGYQAAATAENKEEDQSKASCTLFEFIPADRAAKTDLYDVYPIKMRFTLIEESEPTLNRCVSVKYHHIP